LTSLIESSSDQNGKHKSLPLRPSGSPPKSLPPIPKSLSKKNLPAALILESNRDRDSLASPEENEELRKEERELMNNFEGQEDPDDEEKEIFRMVEEEATPRGRSKAVIHRPPTIKPTNGGPTYYTTPSTPVETPLATSPGTEQKAGYMEKWLKSIDSETHPEHRLIPSKDFLSQVRSCMNDFRSSIVFIDQSGVYQEQIKANIFEFSRHDKVIISDIDGTITKSDLMGQVYSRMGKDYTHQGIARLYQSIAENNYKFIYLSARPITMAQLTREYIQSVFQDGNKMPLGPIITSPNKAFNALAREVIIRKPETFKINCLSTIGNLFASDFPFYSGFGNRPTDCISYVSVNIDPTRCYRVNKQGKLLVQATKVTYNSYSELESQILKLFPKIKPRENHTKDPQYYKLHNGQLVSINLPKKNELERLREQFLDPEELQL